jgi:hypothetical protein
MYVCMYVCMYVGYLKPKKVDELFPWVSDLLASVEGSVHSESRWSAEGTLSLTHSLTHSLASNC